MSTRLECFCAQLCPEEGHKPLARPKCIAAAGDTGHFTLGTDFIMLYCPVHIPLLAALSGFQDSGVLGHSVVHWACRLTIRDCFYRVSYYPKPYLDPK